MGTGASGNAVQGARSATTVRLLYLTGVSGTSLEKGYRGWISMLNYTLLGAGEEGFEVSVTRLPDASTPELARRAKAGTWMEPCEIMERRGGVGVAQLQLGSATILRFEPKVLDRGSTVALERLTLRTMSAQFKVNSHGGSLESRHHPHHVSDPVPVYDGSDPIDRYN